MRCPHCPISGPCRGENAARLCELVDPTHPAYNPAYLRVLVPTDPHRVPLAESLRITEMAKRCPYRSPPACRCQGAAACGLRGGADVSAHECFDCVRVHGL